MVWSDNEPPFGHDHPVLGPFVKLGYTVLVEPTVWIRKNIIEKNRGEAEPFYHRRYRRVPTIDECYVDDVICRTEAQEQFMRDKKVESMMLNLLRSRLEDCLFYEKGTGPAIWGGTKIPTIDVSDDSQHKCKKILDTFEKATENYFVKYGELGTWPRVENAFMKQKHRIMWERRHGEIGSGMKTAE